MRPGGSELLTRYPRDPTTGGLDYHNSAGLPVADEELGSLRFCTIERFFEEFVYRTVDDRWTKAVP